MTLNFGAVKAAEENSFLSPGYYRMKISKVEVGKFPKGSAYVGFTFETKEGEKFEEKFGFGTEAGVEASLSRLKYLHNGFLGADVDKNFSSIEDLADYFKKALTKKAIVKTIKVGGNLNNGNIYACLPFAGFIVPEAEKDKVTLGAFDKDSEDYKKVVRVTTTAANESTGKGNGLLAEPANTKADKKAVLAGDDEPTTATDDDPMW